MPKPSNTNIRPPVTQPVSDFDLERLWNDDPEDDFFNRKIDDPTKFSEEIATINLDSLNAELAAWQPTEFMVITAEYLEETYDYIFRATNGKDDIDGTGFDGSEVGGSRAPNGIIVGGDGKDNIEMDNTPAGASNDFIVAGNGKDMVSGGRGSDYIFGENGDDDLRGNRGSDIISGGNGDDDIRGGRGPDHIIGGRDDGTFLVLRTQEEGDDLVENGSFEEPFTDLNADNIEENSPGSNLWYFIDDRDDQEGPDSPDQVLGWDNDDGGAIELQFDETGGVIALDGDVKLELDSGPAFGFTDDETTPLVAQDLSTIADEPYTLTFGAYERADGLSDFQVEWDGQEIDFTYVDGDGPGSMVSSTTVIPGVVIAVDYLDDDGDLTGWNIVTVTGLEASSDTTTIGFEKPGTSVEGEHRGPLIDQVVVEADEDAAAFTLTAGDELWGNQNSDTFYYDFGRGDGVDLIYDFNRSA